MQYHRRSIRLRDYDYAQAGAYFVTVCAYKRQYLFGEIQNGEMVNNDWGQIIQMCWDEIPRHFPIIELDASVVMPNHMHGIILIVDTYKPNPVGATHGSPLQQLPGPKQASLGAIIGQFKSSVTRRLNQLLHPPEHPVWQRNYHEHIIRHEESLNHIRAYVATNPAKWADDSLFSPL